MSFLTQPISLIPTQPQRTIGSISVQVVINEATRDDLTITKQPVQQGASITDHSFLEPTTFTATIHQEANLSASLQDIYNNFLNLQASRQPFSVVTPKRIYNNMLLSSLGMTVDKYTENILALTVSCQQIIIVPVTIVAIPKSNQRNPQSTGATQPAGAKSSALNNSVQSLGKFIGGAA